MLSVIQTVQCRGGDNRDKYLGARAPKRPVPRSSKKTSLGALIIAPKGLAAGPIGPGSFRGPVQCTHSPIPRRYNQGHWISHLEERSYRIMELSEK